MIKFTEVSEGQLLLRGKPALSRFFMLYGEALFDLEDFRLPDVLRIKQHVTYRRIARFSRRTADGSDLFEDLPEGTTELQIVER